MAQAANQPLDLAFEQPPVADHDDASLDLDQGAQHEAGFEGTDSHGHYGVDLDLDI